MSAKGAKSARRVMIAKGGIGPCVLVALVALVALLARLALK